MTCGKSVIFNSPSIPPWYNWNIVDSSYTKHPYIYIYNFYRVSKCYLTASEQFFRYIMAGTNKLRVSSTWVHPWFSDGVRVAHPVVFFVCFCCLCTVSCVPNVASVCFIHSWLPLVFSVLWPVSLLCSFMIAFGFLQRVCQWDDDDVCFVLDQHTWYDFYSACSLKPQSKGRHVTTIGHIILIPSQPVFVLTPQCCTLGGEATNTNFKGLWFDLTALGDKHSDHYTTDVVSCFCFIHK